MKLPFKRRTHAADKKRHQCPIALTANAWIWPPLLIASLLLAQMLKLPISYMLFLFVLLLPLGTVLQLLAARLFIRAAARSDRAAAEKLAPVDFTLVISNNGLIPFPFIEAELLLPDESGRKCSSRMFALSLLPLAGCEIRRTARFRHRGEFPVGVRCLWVYDCFRAVRIRIPVEHLARVLILPRRLELAPRDLHSEDERNTMTVRRFHGSDNTELSDIRSYEKGDSLKSIHWKLSGKSQELLVKDYARNDGQDVTIICDLEPHYRSGIPENMPVPRASENEDADELLTDLVVEFAIACALRELRAGSRVTLLWFDGGRPLPDGEETPPTIARARMASLADFETAFYRFASAPLVSQPHQASALSGMAESSAESSLVFVTAYLDDAAASEYAAIASAHRQSGTQSMELLLCSDPLLFDEPADLRAHGERLETLRRAGCRITELTPAMAQAVTE